MKCRNNVDSTQIIMGLIFCDLSLVSRTELNAKIKAEARKNELNLKALHKQNAHQHAAQYQQKPQHELRAKHHDHHIQQPPQRGFKR
ncbi:MAG: hypothetical protein ACYCQI_13000 [Gammaproteobacteria bacterium]